MTGDMATLACLIVSFATLLTVHVTITLGLARSGDRSLALVAFVIPPLAPYWGWRSGMRLRGALWAIAAVSYCTALWLATR